MKKKGKWRPNENKNQKLLVHVDERIDLIHQSLKTLYFGEQDHIRARHHPWNEKASLLLERYFV